MVMRRRRWQSCSRARNITRSQKSSYQSYLDASLFGRLQDRQRCCCCNRHSVPVPFTKAGCLHAGCPPWYVPIDSSSGKPHLAEAAPDIPPPLSVFGCGRTCAVTGVDLSDCGCKSCLRVTTWLLLTCGTLGGCGLAAVGADHAVASLVAKQLVNDWFGVERGEYST